MLWLHKLNLLFQYQKSQGFIGAFLFPKTLKSNYNLLFKRFFTHLFQLTQLFPKNPFQIRNAELFIRTLQTFYAKA